MQDTKETKKRTRFSIQVSPNQELVLRELSEAMNVPISILVRSIIGDFLQRNDDVLERIITGEHKVDFQKLIEEENEEHTRTVGRDSETSDNND